MPVLQLRLLVLLASAYLLPFVNAECSPYLKESREHPTPNPGKCWSCPDAKEGFGRATIKYGSGWSYDFFTCKYSQEDGRDENNKPYQNSTLLCEYNEKGEMSGDSNSKYCKSAAIPINGCTPVRPASGPVEFCCDPNCKLVTDQCWTCPKLWENIKVNRDWVDITVSRNLLACRYQITRAGGNGQPTILFDAQTGVPIQGENGLAGYGTYTKPAEFVPAEQCTPQPVKPETTQDDYRTFRGILRCPSKAEYCNRRSLSDDCWICPKINGYDAVDEDGRARDFTGCRYYKRNASGSLERTGLYCEYNITQGKIANSNNKECPTVPDKDAECMRLKGLTGNQK